MPLKLCGCLLLVLACFSVGFLLSKRLVHRRDYLQSCKSFIRALKTELRYRGDDIFSAVHDCIGQSGLRLTMPAGDGKPFSVCWEEALDGIPRTEALTAADVAFLRELGAQLGKTDLEGQLSHLSLMETRLDALLGDAQACIDKKSRLYKTMGVFAGASAAILLL